MLASLDLQSAEVFAEALGVHPDRVEAMTFAWLAYRHVHLLNGNLPSVTGASSRPVILGRNTRANHAG